MKIFVTMRIDGRYTCEVDVPNTNIETIRNAAESAFCDADFGELHEIEERLVSYTDKDDIMHDLI